MNTTVRFCFRTLIFIIVTLIYKLLLFSKKKLFSKIIFVCLNTQITLCIYIFFNRYRFLSIHIINNWWNHSLVCLYTSLFCYIYNTRSSMRFEFVFSRNWSIRFFSICRQAIIFFCAVNKSVRIIQNVEKKNL